MSTSDKGGKHWEPNSRWGCNNCLEEYYVARYNYCPLCGHPRSGPPLSERVGALEAWQKDVMTEPFRRWQLGKAEPMCYTHTVSKDELITRLESLERWRRCKYGTYLATEEDVQEWSGRKPDEHGQVLFEGEALTNYLRVEAAGFHWRFSENESETGPKYSAAIRAQPARWTFAHALANSVEAAILMCFSQAVKVFPGLSGADYDRDTKIAMITTRVGN